MKAKQQLRKPENWIDFENLCKKLWGEIWKCPEIKKNGRSGQSQQGVDIYGNPFGEIDYYGIQCKGKNEYSKSELTQKEVDREIELAKEFEPALKKFYFATTASKDSKIETYIRKKNLENIKIGLFEIHLFSWEDIVDLIDENKQTHDYYVNSLNFKTEHLIKFLFENNESEMTVLVPFKKTITYYKQKTIPQTDLEKLTASVLANQYNFPKFKPFSMYSVNKSYCRFFFRLYNLGSQPLEEFKIFLEFEGEFESIDTCTKESHLISNPNVKYDTFIWNKDKQGEIVPHKSILVQDDSLGFDTICLKPFNKEKEIKIHWKLVSLNYKTEGDLNLIIKPDFQIKVETIIVIETSEVRTIEKIEDCIAES